MSWSCLPCVQVLLQMELIMSLDHLPRVGLFIYILFSTLYLADWMVCSIICGVEVRILPRKI